MNDNSKILLSAYAIGLGLAFAVAGCSQAHLQHAPGPATHKISASPVRSAPGWMTSVRPSASVPGFPGGAQPSVTRPAALACHPRTPRGGCYTAGQQCPKSYYGMLGVAADGTRIACTRTGTISAGIWRWIAEPAAG